MKFNLLIAIAIIVCLLGIAMVYVVVTAAGEQQPADLAKWGTLSGMITDKYYDGVPGVQVTLYEARLDPATGQYVNVQKYDSPDNPMVSNDKVEVAALGTYTYYRLPLGTYNVTGEKDGYHWQAIANVTVGTTTLNVNSPDYVSGVSGTPNDTPKVSTVSGMVVDKNKNGIPNATVTLWETRWANDTYENIKPVVLAENPQQTTSDPMVAAIGTYTYYSVPFGIYNITAEKDGHMWFAWVNANSPGTCTNNIAIPDYKLPA